MTNLLAAPRNVMDVLRGERDQRPPTNRTAAATLRARLDEGAEERLGSPRDATPLTIGPSAVRTAGMASVTAPENGSRLARVRGLLTTQTLRLLAAGHPLERIFDDALGAWRCASPEHELLTFYDGLDGDERARLVSDVTAHGVTLAQSLGPLSSSWAPRTLVRAHQRLTNGAVVLRDLVDLMVGTTDARVASIALLDVTTAPLDEGAERLMRYHALLQTLRTAAVPLRTSIFSTATGDLWSAEVDDELLDRAVDDVLALVALGAPT